MPTTTRTSSTAARSCFPWGMGLLGDVAQSASAKPDDIHGRTQYHTELPDEFTHSVKHVSFQIISILRNVKLALNCKMIKKNLNILSNKLPQLCLSVGHGLLGTSNSHSLYNPSALSLMTPCLCYEASPQKDKKHHDNPERLTHNMSISSSMKDTHTALRGHKGHGLFLRSAMQQM